MQSRLTVVVNLGWRTFFIYASALRYSTSFANQIILLTLYVAHRSDVPCPGLGCMHLWPVPDLTHGLAHRCCWHRQEITTRSRQHKELLSAGKTASAFSQPAASTCSCSSCQWQTIVQMMHIKYEPVHGRAICNHQGRSDGGRGVYRDIYPPPKSVYLKFFMWLFCLLDPGQIRYCAIYTHQNQIPGYASGNHVIYHTHFRRLTTCAYSLGGFFDVLHLPDFRYSSRISFLHFLLGTQQTKAF